MPTFYTALNGLRGHSSSISPIISTLDACVTGYIAQRTIPERKIIDKIATILEEKETLKELAKGEDDNKIR